MSRRQICGRGPALDHGLLRARFEVPEIDARCIIIIDPLESYGVQQRITPGQQAGETMAPLTTGNIERRDRLAFSTGVANADDATRVARRPIQPAVGTP